VPAAAVTPAPRVSVVNVAVKKSVVLYSWDCLRLNKDYLLIIAERTEYVECIGERWNARTLCGLAEAKATYEYGSEDQGRRPEERKRLETAVVPAVNYADIGIHNNKKVGLKRKLVFGLWG
jgi:hypothetical protein